MTEPTASAEPGTAPPTTCIEAEPFALRVVDDSMEPEFASGCIIIVDPTGVAKDGAFVVAEVSGEYLFRTLRRTGDGDSLEGAQPTVSTGPAGGRARIGARRGGAARRRAAQLPQAVRLTAARPRLVWKFSRCGVLTGFPRSRE